MLSRIDIISKRLEDFNIDCDLSPLMTGTLFSHNFKKGSKKKLSKSGKISLWYIKASKNNSSVACELAAQELFRMLISAHPKYRVMDDNGLYTYSKQIPGARYLNIIPPEELRTKLLSGEFKGLGRVLVMALFVGEIDLKLDNLCADENGNILSYDGDCCFANIQNAKYNLFITASHLSNLPYIDNYDAFNWLDLVNAGKPKPSLIFADKFTDGNGNILSETKHFRREVNETILEIILLTDELIQRYFTHYLVKKFPYIVKSLYARLMIANLVVRRMMIIAAALQNKPFMEYFYSDDASKFVIQFTKQLQDFTPTGKDKLYEPSENDNFDLEAIIKTVYEKNLNLFNNPLMPKILEGAISKNTLGLKEMLNKVLTRSNSDTLQNQSPYKATIPIKKTASSDSLPRKNTAAPAPTPTSPIDSAPTSSVLPKPFLASANNSFSSFTSASSSKALFTPIPAYKPKRP